MQSTNIEPKEQVLLKYTVKEKLNSVAKADYSSTVQKLIEALGVTRMTLWRIMNIEKDSKSSATSDQLIIMAEFFSCTVDDLLTDRIAADGDE